MAWKSTLGSRAFISSLVALVTISKSFDGLLIMRYDELRITILAHNVVVFINQSVDLCAGGNRLAITL